MESKLIKVAFFSSAVEIIRRSAGSRWISGNRAARSAIALPVGMQSMLAPSRAESSHVEMSHLRFIRPRKLNRVISHIEIAETETQSAVSMTELTDMGKGSAPVTQRNQMWVSRTIT
jgi:hypothetical protein